MIKNFIFKNGFVRAFAALLPVTLLMLTGCETPQSQQHPAADTGHSESIVLREGDVLKVDLLRRSVEDADDVPGHRAVDRLPGHAALGVAGGRPLAEPERRRRRQAEIEV